MGVDSQALKLIQTKKSFPVNVRNLIPTQIPVDKANWFRNRFRKFPEIFQLQIFLKMQYNLLVNLLVNQEKDKNTHSLLSLVSFSKTPARK